MWNRILIIKISQIGERVLLKDSADCFHRIFFSQYINHLYGLILAMVLVRYDQTNNKRLYQKIECIQYNVATAITGAVEGTSQMKLYNELGLKSLKSRRSFKKICFIRLKSGLTRRFIRNDTRKKPSIQHSISWGFYNILLQNICFQIFLFSIYSQCQTQSIFGGTVYSCYCKFRLVTPHDGGWGDENFWFWQPSITAKGTFGNRIISKITSTY